MSQHDKERTEPFFVDEQVNFFKPLVGRYREVVVSCIRELYLRLNGPEADYGVHLTREDVLTIFHGAINRTALMDFDPSVDDPEEKEDRLSVHDRSARILRKLIDSGWITEYADPVAMRKSYQVSGMGRQFSAPFVRVFEEIITDTQNTRSTLANLQHFYSSTLSQNPEVDHLMIATKNSGEIISDLNNLIEELDSKRRQLVKTVDDNIEHAKQAGEDFIDFAQKRLIPEFETRMKTDSIERHKAEILAILRQLQELPNPTKAKIEKRLRRLYPNLHKPGDRDSIFLWALQTIERRLMNACDFKIPELRSQADKFMRRTQMLIDHLTTIAFGENKHKSVFKLVGDLKSMNESMFNAVMDNSMKDHDRLGIHLINPAAVTLPDRRESVKIDDYVVESLTETPDQMRQRYIMNKIETMFAVTSSQIRKQAIKHLAEGRRIQASEVLINDVDSLLFVLNGPIVGSVSNPEEDFVVHPLGRTYENRYMTADDYEIEYVGTGNTGFEDPHV